jgi:hypothetical protein
MDKKDRRVLISCIFQNLFGYYLNINSDRKLIEYCSNCLSVRLFIRYDIDEALPWTALLAAPVNCMVKK